MQDENLIFLNENGFFSDNSIVLGVGIDSLRPDLIRRSREVACSMVSNHAWSNLDDASLLRAAGLVRPDPDTGSEGVTAAGLLLLGTDASIAAAFPGRKIEAKAQALDLHGFDEQEVFQTNLLESFDRLMALVARNLPEGGRIPGSPGTSIRDAVFREIVSNLLVHRDYESPLSAKLTFQRDRVVIENPSRTNRQGLVDLAWSQSIPKNPLIFDFFRNIGLSGNPGTGMQVLDRWGEGYFGMQVLVFDRAMFKVFSPAQLAYSTPFRSPFENMQDEVSVGYGGGYLHPLDGLPRGSFFAMQEEIRVPVNPKNSRQVKKNKSMQDWNFHPDSTIQVNPKGERTIFTGKDSRAPIMPKKEEIEGNRESMQDARREDMQVERTRKIVEFCKIPRNREEIQRYLGLNNRDYFRKEILVPLLQQGILEATIPDKPNSPKQQYRTPAA